MNNQTVAPAHHLPPGTILNNKYEIEHSIGEGGFGITYKGTDRLLGLPVAIKEYYPSGFANRYSPSSISVTLTEGDSIAFFAQWKEKFLAEARTLARANDIRCIVNVRDYFEENGTAYIVMEYLNGITLKQYVIQNGVFDAMQIVRLMIPLLNSLNLIHEQGLIHRDISPDNIMYMDDGTLKLYDFGAARDYSSDTQRSLSVLLKPGYAPQEQYRSKGRQGPWTDVYAMCATMYFCITGAVPEESMQRVFEDELKPPSHYIANIPPHIEAAIIKGLSIRENDRFQTTTELAKALAARPSVSESANIRVSGGNTALMPTQPAVSAADKTAVMQAPVQENATPTTTLQKAEIPEHAAPAAPSQNNNAIAPAVPSENTVISEKKPAKKRRLGLIIGISAAVLAVAACTVAAVLIFGRSNDNADSDRSDVTQDSAPELNGLGGGTVECISDNYTISGATLDAEDIALILKNDVYSLTFKECAFSDNALDDFSAQSTDAEGIYHLVFDSCTGVDLNDTDLSGFKYFEIHQEKIQDFSFIERLTDINHISISCDNISLSADAFADKDSLYSIRLGGYSQKAELTEGSAQAVLNAGSVRRIMLENLTISGDQQRQLRHALPELKQLEHLDVSRCGLPTLELASECIGLTTLIADGNPLEDLDSLNGLYRLTTVSMCDCNIWDISGLSNCSQLNTVLLRNNAIRDISVLDNNADKLAVVDLSGNKELKQAFPHFEKWTHLHALNISGIGNDDETLVLNSEKLWLLCAADIGISSVKNNSGFDALSFVDVSNNKISDAKALEALGGAEVLIARNNALTDLSGIKLTIGTLMLSGNDISAFPSEFIPKYHGKLSFEYNSLLSKDTLKRLKDHYSEVIIEGVPTNRRLEYEQIFVTMTFDEDHEAADARYFTTLNNKLNSVMQVAHDHLNNYPLVSDNTEALCSAIGDCLVNNSAAPLAAFDESLLLSVDTLAIDQRIVTMSLVGSSKTYSANTNELLYDEDLNVLSQLKNLRQLKISFGATDISALSNFTELEHLDISNESVTDLSPISKLTKLQYLDISENAVYKENENGTYVIDRVLSDLSPISGLTELRTLNAEMLGLTDLDALAGLTKLQQLSVRNCSISDISGLRELTALETLDLGGNMITDISVISQLTELRVLNLAGAGQTTDWETILLEDISAIRFLTKLTELDISQNLLPKLSVFEQLTELRSITAREMRTAPSEYPIADADYNAFISGLQKMLPNAKIITS